MVICKYSEEDLRGSGWEVSTGFVNPKDSSLYFTTQAFVRPVPIGVPIIVRYSLDCPDCYEFLWDSIVAYNNYRIRYFNLKQKGYDYEIISGH
jgi:hypothetical protein